MLPGVDALTLSRYANAVLEACQGLLEDEATPPQLVQPLLEVVVQVIALLLWPVGGKIEGGFFWVGGFEKWRPRAPSPL